ncbi:MAG: hypothetical protein QNJ72_44230 [Pleurocapsa sp. MO_226.B13]|nr:hypothetical protein [Pleurocapsa sp. MO_226.B13]
MANSSQPTRTPHFPTCLELQISMNFDRREVLGIFGDRVFLIAIPCRRNKNNYNCSLD